MTLESETRATLECTRRRDRDPQFEGHSRYRIERKLGAGGMGEVYLAHDQQLERKVALKVLRDFGSESKDLTAASAKISIARECLHNEARAMAQIRHPNVVPVYDVGIHGGVLYLAMEFLPGGSLRDWLEENSGAHWSRVYELMLHAGRGLEAAHARGLVHRDFKPDNILIALDGRACVADFGLARARELLRTDAGLETLEDASSMLETPNWSGTPAYMAPEQFDGFDIGPASDLFSYCTVFYEALFGRRPFAQSTPIATREAIHDQQPNAGRTRRGVPRWLSQSILQGLNERPEDRGESLAEFLVDLEARRNRARRRRSLLGVSIASSLAAGMVLGLPRLSPPHVIAPTCDGPKALSERWNEARRAAVFSSLGGEQDRERSHLAARVDRHLSKYADAWIERYESSCTHTADDRGIDSDLQMACLQRASSALDHLSRRFIGHGTELQRHAASAALALPRISECDDLATLRTRVARPTTSEQRQKVAELESQLIEARSHNVVGRVREALAQLQALLPRAEAVGYGPLVGAIEMQLGDIHHDLADLDRAEHFHALALQSAVSNHDAQLAADATIQLIFERGTMRSNREAGERMLPELRARVRAAGSQPLQVAALLRNEAFIQEMRGDYQGSLAHLKRALELTESVAGPDDIILGMPLLNLASEQHRLRNYEMAAQLQRRAIAIYTRALGPDSRNLLPAYNNLADTLGRMGDFEGALRAGYRAVDLCESSAGADSSSCSSLKTYLSMDLRVMGRWNEARWWVESVLDNQLRDQRRGYHLQQDARTELAGIYLAMGAPAAALDLARRGWAAIEDEDHVSPGIRVSALQMLADAERAAGLPAKALARLQRASKLLTAPGSHADLYQPNIQVSLGQTYLALGQVDAALRAFRLGLALQRVLVGDESVQLTPHLLGMSRTLRTQNSPERAATYADWALRLQIDLLGPQHAALAPTWAEYGLAAHAYGDWPAAAERLSKAIELQAASEIVASDLEQWKSARDEAARRAKQSTRVSDRGQRGIL